MSQSARQVLRLTTAATVLLGVAAWAIPAAAQPNVWWVRIGAPGILSGLVLFYRRIWNRKDLAPDFFAATNCFFEKEGFTFVLGTETINGVCHLLVVFQNRYERECEASVLVQGSERMLTPHKLLPDARVSISCGPAAFGKAWVQWAIPKELRGKSVLVEVMASCKYPNGRGRILRYRAGTKVGTAPNAATSESVKLIGRFRAGTPARARLSLPEEVNAVPLPVTSPPKDIMTIWKLADQFTSQMQCEAV